MDRDLGVNQISKIHQKFYYIGFSLLSYSLWKNIVFTFMLSISNINKSFGNRFVVIPSADCLLCVFVFCFVFFLLLF